uniref:Tyrosine-protein phosphatase domain-containing protein n=1 Tax=Panagrolaimus sp. JU765 TaxID=591449 RepID=A0AC34Q1G1_9BILA
MSGIKRRPFSGTKTGMTKGKMKEFYNQRLGAPAAAQMPPNPKPPKRINPMGAGGDAGRGEVHTITDTEELFREIHKFYAEEVRKPQEKLEPKEPPRNADGKLLADILDEEIFRFVMGLFPKSVELNEDTSLNVDSFSVSDVTEISKFDSIDSEEDEPISAIPFGTLETHEDAERRLNIHIASWFHRRFDQGCPFENIYRDFLKMRSVKNPSVHVPYLSYENDVTTKEPYRVRASRINPEDYRGMRFVMCDNPLPETYEDFWRLVWKERARAVVNLRFEAMEDDERCEYWPTRKNPVMQFGDYVIKFRGVRLKTAFAHTTNPTSDVHVYRTTSLSIYNTKKLRIRPAIIDLEIDRLGNKRREHGVDDEYLEYFECHSIKHICFERWPDLLLPIPWGYVNSHSDMAIILSEHVLKQELRNHQRFRGPVIVHSPLGNSRPVCLIALKHSLARLYFDRVIDVTSSILNIYKQRSHCSVSLPQFMMLNLLVMEEALRRGMVEPSYRQKVDRLWDELVYFIGRKYGYALSTFYRGKQALAD